MDDVATLRPTLFIAVPRILERVADGVRAKLAKAPRLAQAGHPGPAPLHLNEGAGRLCAVHRSRSLQRKVRAALGGRCRFIVSGGAPLAPHVEDFCNVCLAPVLQGYGLTETCAASFIMLPDPRLSYTGEVCIRGPMVFSGYFKDPERTKAEFDEDGFFHSGDIGTLTENGCLKIIDRKKNIFKLAQGQFGVDGEYIAVEHLENVFGRSHDVEQIWVYGTSTESVLVAVVVPQQHWWKEQGGKEAAAARPEAHKAMLQELTAVGKAAKLKGFEFIKAVHLEPEPFRREGAVGCSKKRRWREGARAAAGSCACVCARGGVRARAAVTAGRALGGAGGCAALPAAQHRVGPRPGVENDLLTPSMKLKRPQLLEKYRAKIDAMYADLKTAAAAKHDTTACKRGVKALALEAEECGGRGFAGKAAAAAYFKKPPAATSTLRTLPENLPPAGATAPKPTPSAADAFRSPAPSSARRTTPRLGPADLARAAVRSRSTFLPRQPSPATTPKGCRPDRPTPLSCCQPTPSDCVR
eukprot:scaffold14.g1270.t1